MHIEWWIVTFLNIVIMAALGEFLCMKRETMEIPVVASKQGYNLVSQQGEEDGKGEELGSLETIGLEVVIELDPTNALVPPPPPLSSSNSTPAEHIVRVKNEKEQA